MRLSHINRANNMNNDFENRFENDYLLVKKSNMINLVDAVCATKAAMVSLSSVISGSLLSMVPNDFYQNAVIFFTGSAWFIPESFGMALQWLAWTIAIFAGVVSIVNGTKNWFKCEDKKIPVINSPHAQTDQTEKELNEPKQPE